MVYRGRPENVIRPLEPFPPEWEHPVALFRSYLEAQNLARRTIDGYISIIRRLAHAVGKPPAEVITADLLVQLNRGIKGSSMATERIAFRRFYTILCDEELCDRNPAARLPSVKVRKGQPRPMTPAQFNDLFTAGRGAYGSTQAMLLLAGYVGFRAAEIARTRGEMFDLEENTVTYMTKGGYERTQPLHPVIRALVQRMPRRGWWFPSPNGTGPVLAKSVSSRIGNRIRAAGIDDPRITGHSLRHFFGSSLSKAGVDIRVIQELMGHELISSTQIYTQIDQSQKADALQHLPLVNAPIVSALAAVAHIPRLEDLRPGGSGTSRHGSRAAYRTGCRCEPCKDAHAAEARRWRANKAARERIA